MTAPILDIARECGAREAVDADDGAELIEMTEAQLTAFADRVRAEALDEAAKVCEDQKPHRWVDGSDQFGRHCPARIVTTPRDCAAAIRSAPSEQVRESAKP